MKGLKFFIILLSLAMFTNAQAQNPFASFGEKADILTLSNGRYQEVILNDTLIRIGSVLFNVKTNKVVAFINREYIQSEAVLEPDVVSRWLSTDPLAAEFPNMSPYNFVNNNPIYFIDPTGLKPSTHTDKEGNVVAVYNDGDNGVYRHNDLKPGDFKPENDIAPNGINGLLKDDPNTEKMGETEYWDEFARHDKHGFVISQRGYGVNYADKKAKINFGVSIDAQINQAHELAKQKMDDWEIDVLWLKEMSANGKPLDIKNTLGHSNGYLLNGYYTSGESAGNYLFGMNLKYTMPASYKTQADGEKLWWDLTMRQVGAYNVRANKLEKPKLGAPYYGEINYSGRNIARGYWGKDHYKNYLKQFPSSTP